MAILNVTPLISVINRIQRVVIERQVRAEGEEELMTNKTM